VLNALTIDLEPWTCVYGEVLPEKHRVEKSLVEGTLQILDILEDCEVVTTFFCLGIIHDWFPFLLDEIRSRGHEIAFHGHSHTRLPDCSLRREIQKSSTLIEKYEVLGFRAPEMTITSEDMSVLDSAGFLYDSSTYGSFNTRIGGIVEVPVSTYPVRRRVQAFPKTLSHALREFEVPVGSGLFVALLSTRLLDSVIKKINRGGLPAVLFIHPWQLTGLPKIEIEQLIRHPSKALYLTKITEKKLRFVLKMNEFVPVRELVKERKDNEKIDILQKSEETTKG